MMSDIYLHASELVRRGHAPKEALLTAALTALREQGKDPDEAQISEWADREAAALVAMMGEENI